MCDYHYPHYIDEETEAGGLSKKPKGTHPGSGRARTQIKRWAPAATLHHPETLFRVQSQERKNKDKHEARQRRRESKCRGLPC